MQQCDTRWCAKLMHCRFLRQYVRRRQGAGGWHTGTELYKSALMHMSRWWCRWNEQMQMSRRCRCRWADEMSRCWWAADADSDEHRVILQTNLRAAYIRSCCWITIASLKGYFARPDAAFSNAPIFLVHNQNVQKKQYSKENWTQTRQGHTLVLFVSHFSSWFDWGCCHGAWASGKTVWPHYNL